MGYICNKDMSKILALIYGSALIGVGVGLYRHRKIREKCITLKEKKDRLYYDIGGCEHQYELVDTFGNKYHIKRAIMHETAMSHEIVSELTPNKSYNIAYYGFPMKFFDTYPNIINVSSIE